MIVSAKGRYALRVMIALAAREESTVPLKELAAQEEIPYKFLESIMGELAKAGLVTASRGKNGGYRLARSATEITAADILRITETSFTAAACTSDRDCPRAEICPTLPMWKALDEKVDELLKTYSLHDLLHNN